MHQPLTTSPITPVFKLEPIPRPFLLTSCDCSSCHCLSWCTCSFYCFRNSSSSCRFSLFLDHFFSGFRSARLRFSFLKSAAFHYTSKLFSCRQLFCTSQFLNSSSKIFQNLLQFLHLEILN